ncbi:MAG: DUF1566 domain-containing protein [Deltaproteobacteria bacterium]|nr:DUF1566 domain-containing protein [Deltaproteobacteria bacterium]
MKKLFLTIISSLILSTNIQASFNFDFGPKGFWENLLFITYLPTSYSMDITDKTINDKESKPAKINTFVTENFEKLAIDIVAGSGEYIDALSELAEIPVEKKECFNMALKYNFDYFFVIETIEIGCKRINEYIDKLNKKKICFTSGLTYNGDGTITDQKTSLTWMQATLDSDRNGYLNIIDQKTWKNALADCEDLEFAGKSDWRLPTIKELKSIVPMDKAYFPDTLSEYYWSSSTPSGKKSYAAHCVYLHNGNVHWDYKSRKKYIRAVRGVMLQN